MSIINKWTSTSLILRILCGLIIGAILGLLVPKLTWIGILGELFVGALKAIAPPLRSSMPGRKRARNCRCKKAISTEHKGCLRATFS
jgi:Na+/serine symporter